MNIDGREKKNSLSFILKAFNLSTVDLVELAWLKLKKKLYGGDRLKALKIKQSYFFLSFIPSMFMPLCHT